MYRSLTPNSRIPDIPIVGKRQTIRILGMHVLCIALLTCCGFGQGGKANGHVRKAKAAMRIATAELIRPYGRRVITTEQPISAKLENGMWTVSTPQWCQEMLPAQSFLLPGRALGANLQQRRTRCCGRSFSRLDTVMMTRRVDARRGAGAQPVSGWKTSA